MADKTKSIKEATDQELDDLIRRMRKERELQSLIIDIKRVSEYGYNSYDQPMTVSTEQSIEKMYHFGIPGMHWGRKKARGPSSEEHIKKVTLSKKGLHELSNSDIKILTERLQLESNYRNLTKKQLSPGAKFVRDLLIKQGTSALNSYISTKGFGKLKDNVVKEVTKAKNVATAPTTPTPKPQSIYIPSSTKTKTAKYSKSYGVWGIVD